MNDLDGLRPVAMAPLQAYMSTRLQLADILQWLLVQTGPAALTVSTFSTGEEFMRRLLRLREADLITSCRLFVDQRAATKMLSIRPFIDKVFDDVWLCPNHSKVLLLESDKVRVTVITSQNQTRGDRCEAGIITTDPEILETVCAGFKNLQSKAYQQCYH